MESLRARNAAKDSVPNTRFVGSTIMLLNKRFCQLITTVQKR